MTWNIRNQVRIFDFPKAKKGLIYVLNYSESESYKILLESYY